MALHPRIDVFFAVMLARTGREAVEGCDEHVLVQAVFTEYELGGRWSLQQLGGDGQVRCRAAAELSDDGVDERYAALSPAKLGVKTAWSDVLVAAAGRTAGQLTWMPRPRPDRGGPEPRRTPKIALLPLVIGGGCP